jgi:hypothetical protein
MMTVPAATPDTTPVVPTDAIEVLLLLHEPPEVASLKLMVEATHTEDGPVMGRGVDMVVMRALPVMLLVQSVVVFFATTE